MHKSDYGSWRVNEGGRGHVTPQDRYSVCNSERGWLDSTVPQFSIENCRPFIDAKAAVDRNLTHLSEFCYNRTVVYFVL